MPFLCKRVSNVFLWLMAGWGHAHMHAPVALAFENAKLWVYITPQTLHHTFKHVIQRGLKRLRQCDSDNDSGSD